MKKPRSFDDELLYQANYLEIAEAGGVTEKIIFDNVTYIKCKYYGCYCVIDDDDNFVVPVGKYSFVDKFDSGYARVNIEDKTSGTKKWGIINTKGEEVVPLEYDNIWNFYDKDRETILLEKDDEEYWFDLIDECLCDYDPWEERHKRQSYEEENDGYESDAYFRVDDCFDYEGNFDEERLEDAILDGEYVSDDW